MLFNTLYQSIFHHLFPLFFYITVFSSFQPIRMVFSFFSKLNCFFLNRLFLFNAVFFLQSSDCLFLTDEIFPYVHGQPQITGQTPSTLLQLDYALNDLIFYLQPYFLGMIVAIILSVVLVVLSFFLGTNFKILEKEKLSLFECGFIPLNDSRQLFLVNFYRISILFILFDIEISFLFPWATSFYNHVLPEKPIVLNYTLNETFFHLSFIPYFYFYLIYLFLFLLSIGIIYEYKAQALELSEIKKIK